MGRNGRKSPHSSAVVRREESGALLHGKIVEQLVGKFRWKRAEVFGTRIKEIVLDKLYHIRLWRPEANHQSSDQNAQSKQKRKFHHRDPLFIITSGARPEFR